MALSSSWPMAPPIDIMSRSCSSWTFVSPRVNSCAIWPMLVTTNVTGVWAVTAIAPGSIVSMSVRVTITRVAGVGDAAGVVAGVGAGVGAGLGTAAVEAAV